MRYAALEVFVGLFVLLGILAFTVLAFEVSGLTTLYDSEEGYEISAYFDEVGGLKPRSRVAIAGVPIGRVHSIQLEPENFSAHVKLEILPKYKNLIPIDSSASIVTAGLIGDNYIVIEPGADFETLQQGGVLDETHSAVILERLIGQLIFNQNNEVK